MSPTFNNRGKRVVSALEVPCSFCGVDVGEQCRRVNHGGVLGVPSGPHAQRVWDADHATRAFNGLVGDADG